ncbi:hypothetical protein ACO0QE_000572 [Hanseniaspora vineae]
MRFAFCFVVLGAHFVLLSANALSNSKLSSKSVTGAAAASANIEKHDALSFTDTRNQNSPTNQILENKRSSAAEDDPMDQYTTVVDILSQNVIFSKFLQFLQHNDYIDCLNGLDNFTLLAPINSAFYIPNENESEEELVWKRRNFRMENYLIKDSVVNISTDFQNKTAEQEGLFVLSQGTAYPLVWEKKTADTVILYQHPVTTHDDYDNKHENAVVNATVHDAQTLRLLTDSIFKPTLQNCVVYAVDHLLPLKFQSLTNFFESSEQDLDLFGNFTQKTDYLPWREYLVNNTILTPTDKLLQHNLNGIELSYLLTNCEAVSREFAVNLESDGMALSRRKILRKRDPYSDLQQDQTIFAKNFVFEGCLGGLQETAAKSTRNLNNVISSVDTVKNGKYLKINDSVAKTKPFVIDYFTQNNDPGDFGMGYVFENLELASIHESLQFNALKYLLGLQAFDFVDELVFRNLDYLITNNEKELTLFVSVSESDFSVAEKAFDKNNHVDEFSAGYSSSILVYHFIEKKLDLQNFEKGVITDSFHTKHKAWESYMVDSMYCEKNKLMGKSCQKLKILKKNYEDDQEFYVNSPNTKILNETPFVIGNTFIYVISRQLALPATIAQSVGSFLHCSTSMLFLEQLNLLELPANNEGYTVLLPCYDSWEDLQLNFDFIKKNVTALNTIMKNLIWNGLFYTDAEEKLAFETSTLNGDSVSVTRVKSSEADKIHLNVSSVHNSLVEVEKNNDIMFNQGVIHPVSSAYYPDSLKISLKDLIVVSESIDFLMLIEDFDHLSAILDKDLPYSILVPTPAALFYDGDIHANATRLEDILKLHFISENSTEALFQCEEDIHTEYGELISCRKVDSDNYFLRLKNGADKEVRVLKKGCSTNNPHSCVFLIDKPISLSWLTKKRYILHLPYESFAIGILIGVMGFTALSLLVMYAMSYKSQKAAIGFDQATEDTASERSSRGSSRTHDFSGPGSQRRLSSSSLLPKHSSTGGPHSRQGRSDYQSIQDSAASASNPHCNPHNIQTAGAFESQYSENSQSRPITMRSK